MRFERLNSIKDDIFAKTSELYSLSFPIYEQRTINSQIKALDDCEYHYDLIFDDNTFVGLMLYWENDSFIYIEHFCILPEMRNRKYGQKAMEQLKLKGKALILEIDPPYDTISIRRLGFYSRLGYKLNKYEHRHPAYRPEYSAHPLRVMSYPKELTDEEYSSFFKYLNTRVMDL